MFKMGFWVFGVGDDRITLSINLPLHFERTPNRFLSYTSINAQEKEQWLLICNWQYMGQKGQGNC